MNPPGQRRTAPPAGGRTWCLFCLLLLATGGFGCRNLYHTSRTNYSPAPEVRLERRIAEAQQAEESARRAALRLCERFAQGLTKSALAPDIDRLETAAYELRRRVASVADAASAVGPAAKWASERQRLEQRSTQWLEAVACLRQGEAGALAELEHLLPEPGNARRSPGY